MTKIERAARRLARDLGFVVLSSKNVNGHHHLILALAGGATKKITFASSPRCLEHSLAYLAKDIKALAATLPPPTA